MRNIKRSFWNTMICALTLVITSCGFHLSGQVQLAPPLHRMYIQSADPYSQLVRNLTQALKLSQVTVVPTPAEASTILNILSETESQQLLSVGGTQQTRQYSLVLSVVFQVTDNTGKMLVPPQTATQSTVITITANQVLAGSNEADNLYNQMRRSIVFDILYRLSSKSTTKSLSP